MIRNDRQYKITKAQAKRFREALHSMSEAHKAYSDEAETIESLTKKAIASQLDDLEEQLLEYETLRSGSLPRVPILPLEDLPDALIRARIAKRLTQRELADKLGLKEQQIQRYEATQYAGASLERIREVMAALNVSVFGDVLLDEKSRDVREIVKRLENRGIAKDFIFDRVLPPNIAGPIKEGLKASNKVDPALGPRLITYVANVFNFPPENLFSKSFALTPAASVRFKIHSNVNQEKLSAYAVYAQAIASIVLRGCSGKASSTDAIDSSITGVSFHQRVKAKYKTFELRSILNYIWDLGIPIVPLADRGGFHGACWRMNNRHVIVLKQKNHSRARWMFDALHEYRHTLQHSELKDFSIVEEIVALTEDKDEEDANDFAAEVLLGSDVVAIEEDCVKACNHKIERLKSAVERVAAARNVHVDVLANHMAFRLSEQGQDWWGAAHNLQAHHDADQVAREVFIERFNFPAISRFERDLIMRAISSQS